MPSHAAAEHRFRRLVADAGLPAPDAVEYEEDSLTFFWVEPRVAVVVELGDDEALPDHSFGIAIDMNGEHGRAPGTAPP